MIGHLTPRQLRALDALNRELVRKTGALIDELSQGARDAVLSPHSSPAPAGFLLEHARQIARIVQPTPDLAIVPHREPVDDVLVA